MKRIGLFSLTFTTLVATTHAASVDFSNLVERVAPAVVSVNVTKKMSQEDLLQQQVPEILRRFFGPQIIIPQAQTPQQKTGFGSAFFIDQEGYLITNHHVVEDASKVTITLNDRREIDATVIGSDERTDVALLKVQGKNFPQLRTGSVDRLRVGEPVLAIGSPFGFDYSASAGIVSAKMRSMGETTVPFIQTDVALNPGNSGGPLFNQQGEVVGVNSRIFSGTGGYMGLSFSIPIDVAMDVAEQLKKNGRVNRGYLGVQLQDLDRTLAEAYQLDKPEGALISQVMPNSPAAKAGLQVGDVIYKYNGQVIARTAELINLIGRAKANDTANIEVLRDQSRRSIKVKLSAAPDQTVAATSGSEFKEQSGHLGLSIRDLSTNEQRQLQVSGGVLVQDVRLGGLAAEARILPGDVIVQVNQQSIQSSGQFAQYVRQLKAGSVARVMLLRQGQRLILGMRV